MTPAPSTSRAQHILRLVVVVAALTVFFFALRWVKNSGLLDQSLKWIQNLGPWAPVVFMWVGEGR